MSERDYAMLVTEMCDKMLSEATRQRDELLEALRAVIDTEVAAQEARERAGALIVVMDARKRNGK